MQRVELSRLIDVPTDAAWRAIDAFGDVAAFHPLVESSPIINDVATGEGAARECHFYDGSRISEKIIEYWPGRGYRVELIDKGPFPMKRAFGGLRVEPDGDRTRATFVLSFEPKFGPIGWLMAQLALKPKLRSVAARVLDGLETHVKTGKRIGPRGQLLDAA